MFYKLVQEILKIMASAFLCAGQIANPRTRHRQILPTESYMRLNTSLSPTKIAEPLVYLVH